jgi:hypothetical protein
MESMESMESLNKIGDNLNPEVHFDQKTGSLSIRGKSIPLNIDAFFVEVIRWLEQYQEQPHNPTNLEIDLKYLNGQSIRTLLAILTKMKKINDGGSAVNINWTIPEGAEDLLDLRKELLDNFDLGRNIQSN